MGNYVVHSNDRQVHIMKAVFSIMLVSLVLSCPLASAAHAAQLVNMTPKEMAAHADLVVRGSVSQVQSFWNDKHSKIFTKATITVAETYKGDKAPSVEVIQLGGIVGDVKMTVEGALGWKAGEEVLLFLEPYTQGAHQVTGLSQGKFAVERDPKTGDAFISRPALENVQLVQQQAAEGKPVPVSIERVPLARFIQEALGGK
jgi:hypothetical protein